MSKHFALAILLAAGSVYAGDPPALPQVYITTTIRSSTPGTTTHVASGGNLQTAINNAACGDKITLEAGATFTGNFTLPDKDCTDGNEVYITSDSASLPAPGTRVGPSDVAQMAKLTAGSGTIIQSNDEADHYRLIGLEITPSAFLTNLVALGPSGTPATKITFDRVYIHGHATLGSRRCIYGSGTYIAVIDSYISACMEVGADTQAFMAFRGVGPYKIVNNYLEGATENLMLGGQGSAAVPADVEIRRNHFFKPLSWWESHGTYAGTHWSVKNLFELKVGNRVLVENNLFENSWLDGQQFGFNIKSTDQDGTFPTTSWTRDVTIRGNLIRNSAGGANLTGFDGSGNTNPTARIGLYHNVWENIGTSFDASADGHAFLVQGSITSPTIEHQTVLHAGGNAMSLEGASGLQYRYNIQLHGGSGVKGSGVAEGTATLEAKASGYIFTDTVIQGATCANYPTGTLCPADIAAIGFENYAGGDYRLDPASNYYGVLSDGSDIGAWVPASITAESQLDWTLSIASSAYETLVVDFGVPGLPANQSCTVRYGNQSVVSSSGGSTRQVVIEGLTPGQSYFVGVDCGDTWGGWLSWTNFTASQEPDEPPPGQDTKSVLFSVRPPALLSTVARVTIQCSLSADMSNPVTNDADNIACTSAAACSATLAAVPIGVNYCQHIYQTNGDVTVATSKPQQIAVQ